MQKHVDNFAILVNTEYLTAVNINAKESFRILIKSFILPDQPF